MLFYFLLYKCYYFYNYNKNKNNNKTILKIINSNIVFKKPKDKN